MRIPSPPWLFLSLSLAGALAAGCVDDDLELGTSAAELLTAAEDDIRVYANNIDRELVRDARFTLAAGESVYLAAKGVTTQSSDEVRMQALAIQCIDANDGTDMGRIQSSENRDGTTERHTQHVRKLFKPGRAGDFICWSEARAGDSDGPTTNAWHTYLAGETYIERSGIRRAGTSWRWGTELDPTYADWELTDPPGVHLGPGMPAGTSENALRSPRVTVPAGYSYLDTRFELAMTNCKYHNSACLEPAWGHWYDFFRDAVVEFEVVAHQMTSDTGTTVCRTTRTEPQQMKVTNNEVHRKLHFVLDDIPVSSACSSRTFKLQLAARWISGNPVRFDYGREGRRGYSTGFGWVHN